MNKFLVKKRAKDASPLEDKTFDAPPMLYLPQLNTPIPPPPSPQPTNTAATAAPAAATAAKRGWLRKKQTAEAKPAVDLTTALPSAENFRTSLLMPNLSARFSMLRDQDDPLSLMGKASDDSVLQPKRRSRLGDFDYMNLGALSDIAEVSSIKDARSLDPGRQASYNSGETADDDSSYSGSIMSRARPGEGNMLFGGRQKIYRIPIGDSGSVSNLGSGEGRGMRGRALYEDDISLSAFQRLRHEEKQEQQREEEAAAGLEQSLGTDADGGRERTASPALSSSYSDKRETASSTNSRPSVQSIATTAATSVTGSSGLPSPALSSNGGQPPIPEKSKSRKLYDLGLDQHLQEQQSAAVTRLDSFKRGTPARLAHSRSAFNLTDRPAPRPGVYVSTAASVSAAPSPAQNEDSRSPLKPLPTPQVEPSPPGSRSRTPDLRPDPKNSNALMQALDPSDRGKATAMGTFSKPKQFSEQQYLQRQISLVKQRQERNSNDTDSQGSQSHGGRSSEERPSSSSNSHTDRSISSASLGGVVGGEESRQGVSVSLQKRSLAQQELLSQASSQNAGEEEERSEGREGYYHSEQRTRDTTPSGSARAPDSSSEIHQTPPPPPMFKHPAMRAASQSLAYREKRNAWSPDAHHSKKSRKVGSDDDGDDDNDCASSDYFEFKKKSENDDDDDNDDSESLGVDKSSGLTGLIREHLRHASNQSSIYPPKSPAPWEHNSAAHSYLEIPLPTNYNTYDADDLETNPYAADFHNGTGVGDDDGKEGWSKNDSKRQHNRGASSETQHERQAFASELAERQRTIQENLKVKVHNGARAPSPGSNKNGGGGGDGAFMMPFGLLRRPSSREATGSSSESNGKTLRMLGMSPNTSNNSLVRADDNKSNRNRTASPPAIGRTLHSKMIRSSEEYGRITSPNMNEYKPQESRRGDTGSPNIQEPKALPVRTSPPPPLPPLPPSSSSSPPPPDTSPRSTFRRVSSSEGSREKSNLDRSKYSIDTERSRSDGNSNGFWLNGNEHQPASSFDSTRSHNQSSNSSLMSCQPVRFSDRSVEAARPPPLPSNLSVTSKRTPPSIETASPYSASSTPSLSNASSPVHDGSRAPSFTPSILHETGSQRFQQQENSFNATFKHSANGAARLARRKGTLQKSDISEPTLLASTANFDTVALPSGATLMNGMKDDVDVVVLHNGRSPYMDDSAPSPTVSKGNSGGTGGGNGSFINSSKKNLIKAFGRKMSDHGDSDDGMSLRSTSNSLVDSLASKNNAQELGAIGSPSRNHFHEAGTLI